MAAENLDDPATDRLLDAALEVFEDFGLRRGTVDAIADRAGVDRVTVYRRLGTKDEIIQTVLARESRRMFERVASHVGRAATLEDRIVRSFTALALALWSHQLFNRMIRIEPQVTLPKVTTGATDILAMATSWAVEQLQPAATGPDLAARCEVIVRILHSMALTPHVTEDLQTEEQLARFARRYIVPIITRP